jgi:hypothetical protein
MNALEKSVHELILKAAQAENPLAALQYSQAACNAANAMCSLKVVSPKQS